MKTLTLDELIKRLLELKAEGHGNARVLMFHSGATMPTGFAEVHNAPNVVYLMDPWKS